MPAAKGPQGVTKKTVRKNTKKVREQAKRLSEVNRLQSPLLKLPAELRNRIYEFTLVDDAEIRLTSASREPPLLHSSRQIRSEALKIYYFSNSFTMDIVDCNARLYGRFAQRTEGTRKLGGKIAMSPCIVGKPNWSNLLAWCKDVHRDQSWGINSANGRCGQMAEVVATATSTAEKLWRKCSWEECQEVIERMRPLAALGDARWNDENDDEAA